MSKLQKLIKSPKEFFNDSIWFKTNTLDLGGNYKNVFIVSHLGQLNQVEALIEYEQLKNCLLVILYTNKNTNVPKSIQNQYNKNLFDHSILFLLPNFPNNYQLKSLVFMKRNYEKLIDTAKPENLYLLSFENHYSLLSNYARSQNIKVNLIDEGTATYKSRELSEYYTKHHIIKRMIAKVLNVDSSFDWFRQYNAIYAAFPKLLKENFKAKSFNRFFAHAGKNKADTKTKALIQHYNITSNDFLYVNQRYAVNHEDFVQTTLEILNKISKHYNANIFIKLHPKDSEAIKKSFVNNLTNFQNLIFIKENEFLIEPTIQAVEPRGVIGLTSTSLVYAPLVSPKTKVYSIQPWFINLVPKKNNETGLKILNDHFQILNLFKHVLVLNDEKTLENLQNVAQNDTPIQNQEEYKKIAREAYSQHKYQKTIINFLWVYPHDMTDMPMEDLTIYLDALWKLNDMTSIPEIIQSWIEAEIQRKEKKNIKDYSMLLELITHIIKDYNENANPLWFKTIYNNLIALFTSKLSLNHYPIKLLNLELMLIQKYSEQTLFLLSLRAKKYMQDTEYEKALTILNEIFLFDNFILENKTIYIDILVSLIKLHKKENIDLLDQKITKKPINDTVKLMSKAHIAIYNSDYDQCIDLLEPEINNFNKKDKQELKPEVLLAEAYKQLGNYEDAKKYLKTFENHTQGNVIVHKEISYLEYKFNNYSKAKFQLDKAYNNDIKSMSIDDFVLYLDILLNLKEYENIISYTKDKLSNHSILFYHLASLYYLSYYHDFLENKKIYDSNNTQNIVHQELLTWFTIDSYRQTGHIEDALKLIKENDTTIPITIEYLICKADIYELSREYNNAHEIWKIIIGKFNDTMPHYAWERYYLTLNSSGLK